MLQLLYVPKHQVRFEEEGYTLSLVFNADVTGLWWQRVQSKTLGLADTVGKGRLLGLSYSVGEREATRTLITGEREATRTLIHWGKGSH